MTTTQPPAPLPVTVQVLEVAVVTPSPGELATLHLAKPWRPHWWERRRRREHPDRLAVWKRRVAEHKAPRYHVTATSPLGQLEWVTRDQVAPGTTYTLTLTPEEAP